MEDNQPLLESEQLNPENEVPASRRPPRRPKAAISALLAVSLCVNLAASLYQLPLNRVVERRLCYEHYAEHDPSRIGSDGYVPEQLCKIDAVQQDLGRLQGVMDTIWIVGDFIMTIPLGFAAEKYGQRTVLHLNLVPRIFMLSWAVMVGYFDQSLPTGAIIAGPILSVLGGDCVFNSITYALAAGISDDYVLRATYFGWMSSVSYVVALLGPALASASMSMLLWLPFWIGIALLLVAVPIISLLPEHQEGSATEDLSSASDESRRQVSSPVLKAQGNKESLASSVVKRFETLRNILASHPRNLMLLFVAFFLTSLASSDTKLLAQYISKRYEWTFSSAGYLLSGKAVVNFILLTTIIPTMLKSRHGRTTFETRDTSSDRANVRGAIACLLVSVVGAFAIALAAEIWFLVPSLLVYALGSALPVFTLSLLKSPAIAPKKNDVRSSSTDPETHIFSLVMLVKTLGSLVGAPLMAVLWIQGIAIGKAALGMPYFVSAACYALTVVLFSRIKLSS